MGSKLIKSEVLVWIGALVAVSLFQACLANDGEGARKERFLGSLFGIGHAPLPGDITNPVVCERYCRNRCLSNGYSGYLGVPGCNQFCDCTYYLGGGRPWGY